jgi:hypothetical protein
MSKIRIFTILACLIAIGAANSLYAQSDTCGTPSTSAVDFVCCNQHIWVEGTTIVPPGGMYFLGLQKCSGGCNTQISIAQHSWWCIIESLNTPDKIRELNAISQKMPLLVASCKGGLVPYLPRPIADSWDIDRRFKQLPIPDTKTGGE